MCLILVKDRLLSCATRTLKRISKDPLVEESITFNRVNPAWDRFPTQLSVFRMTYRGNFSKRLMYDQNFPGGRGGHTFKPPPPTNNFCLYPPLVLRCFWKDPLMTPITPLQASFTATPLPIHQPSLPPKNSDYTPDFSTRYSLLVTFYLLLVTHCFFTRYSLLFTRYFLLITRYLFARYPLLFYSLFVNILLATFNYQLVARVVPARLIIRQMER